MEFGPIHCTYATDSFPLWMSLVCIAGMAYLFVALVAASRRRPLMEGGCDFPLPAPPLARIGCELPEAGVGPPRSVADAGGVG